MANVSRLRLALGFLLPIHLAVLSARFFSPYDPDVQNRDLPYAPPTCLHWMDARGKMHLRPFIYPWVSVPEERFATYRPDLRHPMPVHFLVHSPERTATGTFHARWRLFGTPQGGAPIFLLGADEFGRDQLSRLLYGGQVSLLAGFTAAALSVGLGLFLGSVAGFYGGMIDDALMRLTELFLALPWLYSLFALRAFLPLHTPPRESLLLIIIVIGIIGWARPARLIRGAVLSAKARNYVVAARGFGASDFYLFRRHVLPQILGIVLTQAGLLVPTYILAEVALSYLGLGTAEPVPSLGNMLAEVQVPNITSSHWWMLLPGVALIPLLLGYHSLTDALHEWAGIVQV